MIESRRMRRDEGYGACDDEVEEARAELYREQARAARLENEEREKKTGSQAGDGGRMISAPAGS